jgi:hypothetical protein
MGFDFCIATINNCSESKEINLVEIKQKHLYFSYNWSGYKSYWYIRDHLFGRSGEDASQYLKKAIEQLEINETIEVGMPDYTNPSWYWGLTAENKRMEELECKGVFLFHLKDLLQLATKHKQYYFISTEQSQTVYSQDGSTELGTYCEEV